MASQIYLIGSEIIKLTQFQKRIRDWRKPFPPNVSFDSQNHKMFSNNLVDKHRIFYSCLNKLKSLNSNNFNVGSP